MSSTGETVTLAGIVPAAYALADRVAAASAERESQRGSGVSCAKGCSSCCRYLVRISIPEAIYLGEQLTNISERLAAKLRGIGETAERIEAEGLADRLRSGLIRRPQDTSYDYGVYRLAQDYLRARIPCPFLEGDSCSIYAHRPAVCRQYLVTSPAALCHDPFMQNVRRIGAPNVADHLARFTAELLAAPYQMIALPLAIEWLASHVDIASRRFDRAELLSRWNEAAGSLSESASSI